MTGCLCNSNGNYFPNQGCPNWQNVGNCGEFTESRIAGDWIYEY